MKKSRLRANTLIEPDAVMTLPDYEGFKRREEVIRELIKDHIASAFYYKIEKAIDTGKKCPASCLAELEYVEDILRDEDGELELYLSVYGRVYIAQQQGFTGFGKDPDPSVFYRVTHNSYDYDYLGTIDLWEGKVKVFGTQYDRLLNLYVSCINLFNYEQKEKALRIKK